MDRERNIEGIEKKIATRDDWDIEEMPKKHATFILEREFTAVEMATLKLGNIPQEMEDKWFWYMEDNTLYAHRSWTGICIFTIQFNPNNKHLVTVNRDKKQYSNTNIKEDMETVNNLLGWWIKESYDYRGQWLSETISFIEKSKR